MILLVDLPKPLHGQSNVNRMFTSYFDLKKHIIINTAPSFASFFFPGKLWQIFRLLNYLVKIPIFLYYLIIYKEDIFVYRSINTGKGQIIDCLILFFCKIFKRKVIIHHHSFAYFNRYSKLFSYLLYCHNDILHICLGDVMKSELKKLYKVDDEKILTISNAAFFDEDSHESFSIKQGITFGYLSNITFEKGIKLAVESVIELNRTQTEEKICLKVAGPFMNQEVENYVLTQEKENEAISYIGPLYGNEKTNFYQSIDIFIFPSNYKNEAEPLVLHEAVSSGALPITTNRGCMPQITNLLSGIVIDDSLSGKSDLIKSLNFLISSDLLNEENRIKRKKIYYDYLNQNKNELRKLMHYLS